MTISTADSRVMSMISAADRLDALANMTPSGMGQARIFLFGYGLSGEVESPAVYGDGARVVLCHMPCDMVQMSEGLVCIRPRKNVTRMNRD